MTGPRKQLSSKEKESLKKHGTAMCTQWANIRKEE
jgi:hypothetical protein